MPASQATVEFVTKGVRWGTPAEDASVKTRLAEPGEREIPGLFQAESPATAEAQAVLDLFSGVLNTHAVEIPWEDVTFKQGDTITIVHPDFDFAAGKDVIVTGISGREGSDFATVEVFRPEDASP
ncbi:MAG: hypothetical protein MI755_16270 [Sphingomonadales bacterium]|nr:hypothetical protein [Sphingomonadales bacterium]